MDTVMTETMNLILKKVNALDERFDQMDNRLDRMDERFDKMDERFDKMDERFDKMDERFGKMDERFGKMDERFDRMDERFDALEDQVHDMGLYIENVINKKTQALFDAYDVTRSHFIEEERIKKLEDTVELHDHVIMNHSMKLNQMCC